MPDPTVNPTPSPGGVFVPGAMPSPDSLQTQMSPNSGVLAGLSGDVSGPANSNVSGPATPGVSGPATQGQQQPNPGADIAQNVVAALSGDQSGHPMDWARALFGGVLAGASAVGRAPAGSGLLYGAARGAAGVQELQRQKMLDQQAQQQRQLENTLKQKQDARAEQELQIHMQDAATQRAYYGAMTAGMIATQNQNAEKFKLWEKEAPLEYGKMKQEYDAAQDKLDEAHGEMIGVIEAATGKKITDYPLVTNSDDLTSQDAQDASKGFIFPVHNGETHAAGEDGVGVYKIPGYVWDLPIKKPVTLNRPDGQGSLPAQTGTSVATLGGIIMGKQKAALDQQKLAMDKLDLQMKQAQIRHENAETEEAHARAALVGKPNDPVYATYQDAQGATHTVLTTKGEATQKGYGAIRPVKETDISKDQHDIKVLNDIQAKSDNVTKAASIMDNTSWKDSASIAKYLADNPNTTLNTLVKSKVFAQASPQAQAYAIAINSLRESSMGLQKVLTGTARTNEVQLQALLNTLPGVEPNSGIVKNKLDAFTQNLQMLRQGLPEGTGIEINTGAKATAAPQLPQAPSGQVSVQIPGQPPGFIPKEQLAAFQAKHPNAVVSQ